MRKIILASGSPRRKELMQQAGYEFEIAVSDKEEKLDIDDPAETVRILSAVKAKDVALSVPDESVVIGADTVVACDGRILGKPADEEDAFRMLSMLQGRTHQVYTGVTVIRGGKVHTFSKCTDVTMYPVSDEDIRNYIKTGEPMDKAGAYAIQGRAAVFVKEINGDYNNVVGLPIAALWQYLEGKEDPDASLSC